MLVKGVIRLLVEQGAVVGAVLAYLTGIITIRPRPDTATLMHSFDDSLDRPVKSAEVDKTVLVVIDALRADHLVSTRQPLMPHLHKLLESGNARGYVLHTSSPTVTLPRLKSMVTGGIPGFMDVVENFGASELTEDNLIRRWKEKGRRIHFYGDDTWLRLFPHHFNQHQAVTSFFVSDYTEVDRSVTQHLERELSPSAQWDVLILHYLGLDHIGHLEGPTSHLIGPKLIEMDTVLRDILKALQDRNERFLIVVCGDHGMSDAGGHGGSSHSEVTTSALLISNTFPDNMDTTVREARQIDLTTTLAVLTGLDIPVSNLGRPLPFVLAHLDLHKRLAGHRRVARQLLSVARSCGLNPDHGNAELLFEEATRLHKLYLESHPVFAEAKNTSTNRVKDGERAVRFYQESERVASKELTSRQQSYDLPTIFTSLLAVLVICLISLSRHIRQPPHREVMSMLVAWCCVVALVAWLLLCAATPATAICHPLSPTPWLLVLPVVYILVVTATALASVGRRYVPKSSDGGPSGGWVWWGCVGGCAVHTISLLGTSLVEEEHQTVYFLATSLHFALVISLAAHTLRDQSGRGWDSGEVQGADLKAQYIKAEATQGGRRSGGGKWGQASTYRGLEDDDPDALLGPTLPTNVRGGGKGRVRGRRVMVVLGLSLMLARVLRAWNATGDKWRHLEDLGDMLRGQGERVMIGAVMGGLGLTLALLGPTCWPLVLLACAGTYGHHFPFLTETGTLEAQLAHVAVFFLFVRGLWRAQLVTFRPHNHKDQSHAQQQYEDQDQGNEGSEGRTETLLRHSYVALALLALLLQRADNTPLLALLLLQDRLAPWFLHRLALTRRLTPAAAALTVHVLALAHFFYQGNSNSLSTIEVRSGFVGIGSFHPALHGILIATHTLAAPALTHLAYLTHLNRESRHQALGVWWCARVSCLALYLANLTFQRHHLFIWTVFTPKLLYEGAHTLSLTALTLYVWGVEKVCTVLQVTYRFE